MPGWQVDSFSDRRFYSPWSLQAVILQPLGKCTNGQIALSLGLLSFLP